MLIAPRYNITPYRLRQKVASYGKQAATRSREEFQTHTHSYGTFMQQDKNRKHIPLKFVCMCLGTKCFSTRAVVGIGRPDCLNISLVTPRGAKGHETYAIQKKEASESHTNDLCVLVCTSNTSTQHDCSCAQPSGSVCTCTQRPTRGH